MKQHLKRLIHNLITLDDKGQAIVLTIKGEQNEQAKQDLLNIKQKYKL